MADSGFSENGIRMCLKNVGKGSDFRYESAMVPMDRDHVRRMLSDTRDSFTDTSSEVFRFRSCIESGRGTNRRRQHSILRRHIVKIDSIMAMESDILDQALRILDAGDTETIHLQILASALMTISRINGELVDMMHGWIPEGVSIGQNSGELSGYVSELSTQGESVRGILA